MLDYTRLVRAAESLDPVPVSVTRLLSVVARDNFSVSDVEQVIVYDQALTGRLLRVANSWASASLVPIGTVKDAVIRVGVGPVVSMTMAACVGPSFRRALPEYGLSENDLWRHSVAASLAAEVVSAMSRRPVPPEAATAALLHDVGKLVLARFLTPDLLAGLAEARAGGDRSVMQAESVVLGVNHAELGGIIARHWGLPDRIAEAITHHHQPDKAAERVCDVVHLANVAARLVVGPPPEHEIDATPAAGAVARLDLAATFMDRLTNHVNRRFEEVVARYDVVAASQAA